MKTARRQSPKKVHAFLEKMNALGELIPGAATSLSEMGAAIPDTDRCLGEMIAYLHGEGITFLSARGKAALNELPPLQFLLERLPLRKGSAEELNELLAADLVGFPPGEQATIAMARLRKPGMAYHFAGDGSPSVGEQRTRAVLHVFRDSFREDLNLDDLAARWTEELGRLPFHRACQRVAMRLEDLETAAGLTAHGGALSFDPDDSNFRSLTPDQETELVEQLTGEVEELRAEPLRELKRLRQQLATAEAEGRALRERYWAREAQ